MEPSTDSSALRSCGGSRSACTGAVKYTSRAARNKSANDGRYHPKLFTTLHSLSPLQFKSGCCRNVQPLKITRPGSNAPGGWGFNQRSQTVYSDFSAVSSATDSSESSGASESDSVSSSSDESLASDSSVFPEASASIFASAAASTSSNEGSSMF